MAAIVNTSSEHLYLEADREGNNTKEIYKDAEKELWSKSYAEKVAIH